MTKQSRVQSGVPAGGEFAATAHAEPTLGLEAPVPFLVLGDAPASPEFQAAALEVVMRRGEQFAASSLDIPVIMAANPTEASPTPPTANPAAVFSGAVGTDKDPNSIPWPEKPARDGYVEVDVWEDAALQVLENAGYDEDILDGFTGVYVGISLAADKEVDFYGVKANGETEMIAMGVREYEHAVDSDYHEDLRYRDGYENPMPAYIKARKEVDAQRSAASAALLAEAGVTVELEDLRRGHYRVKRGMAKDMRLEIHDYRTRMTETTNWHQATDEHYAAFLDGDPGEDGEELLKLSAVLVARDLQAKAYKEMSAR